MSLFERCGFIVEVLKQLQGTIEEESGEASGSQLELIEKLKEMSLDSAGFKPRSRPPQPPSSSSSSASSGSGAPGGAAGGSGAPGPTATGIPRRGLPTAGRDSHDRCLEELEKERSLLLAELEKEEKEKDWYYAQLQNLTKRIDSLPLTENFTLQTDMSRRQLEFEARQIRSAMEEQLGSCQEMERRAQARVSRIQQIEKDILRLGARLQVEEGQGASDGSGLPGAQSSSSRLDHEPANEASYSVPRRITSHLGTKVEMVYSLLSMLGTHDKDDMSRTLLAMSSSQDSCIAMRQSGCLPLLIQLLHGNDKDSLLLGNSRGSKEARARASAALHNIVHSQPDDKRGRREIRVLHLLEQVRHYCEACWSWQENHERGVDQEDNPMPSPVEHQICPAVCVLMKLSFDEEHRHAMNELGGLQAVAELLQVDCEMFGLSSDHYSVTLRRYAGMALTNLTFGDVANKATLCSMKGCMRAMVAQLKSDSEDLQQVIASVLRNLSWRADVNSKKTLREVGSVRALTGCALEVQKESTLKSVLSALWNLSAHCTENKADICAVDGALAFLVGTLTHRSHTNTLAIIESGGGILRNVSSLIATNEAHRQVLREHGCLPTLLQHLKSHSLTIVSNACGTLWNLSARDAKDQEALWELGAVGMLRNLIHSRHKMIAMGSAAALRNLMANRPARYKDASVVSPGAGAPSLHARKQKALFEELDAQQLSETFDNIDNLSPKAAHRKGRGCNGAGGGGGSTTRSYANTPVLSSPKNGDGSKRTSEEAAYARPVFPPSVRASSDSLNSVTSADGYGNRGKTKPSSEPFYSSDESGANKCCVYRKYPADLAHKIRSANHMADDDGAELDTPINYSLKYSDEQLNSGRQSPSHRGSIESDEDDELDTRLGRRNDGGDSAPTSSRMASVPQQRYGVTTGASNYGGESTGEQPIDYSLKYGADATRKPLFKPEETATPSVPPPPSSSTNKLRPPASSANRTVPKSNQESTQTYCVEDTPICFSRGSSLSSLSSEEEEEDGDVIGRKRRGGSSGGGGGGSNDYPTLPVSEKDAHEQQQRQQKEAESQTATAVAAPSSRGRRGHHHHHGHAHHHHHHHVTSSGARTPKSPPEQPYAQETPLMFSRCTSVSSLDSFSTSSIASSVRSSEPCSGVPSGVVSPSDLPDSPGQTMPPSRAKTPPLPPPAQNAKEEKTKKKDEEESSADVLLHFATESTPHGFSRASSLSALSLDEPYITAELKEEEEGAKEDRKEDPAAVKPILDESDDDDDIEILEACINMAMPKSSRKPKKQQQAAPRKPSQLPVYKLLPPQSRTHSQQRKDVPLPPPEEVPRVYCVEGTPLNFSTATSLSDLTIDSPPNEEAAAAAPVALPTTSQRRGAGLPEGENGDDILAECISAAMPKAKPRKPIRAAANSEHLQAPPLPPPVPPPLSLQQQKKKPTSPVKPMPQRVAYGVATATVAKAKPGFAFDSPHHYTPIEGTPCCFSRNDSLSSLDFDEDDGGEKDEEKKTKEDGRKRKQQTAAVFPRTKPVTNATASDEKQKFAIEDTPVCFSRNSSLSSLSDIDQENNNKEFAPPPPPPPPPSEQQDGGKAGMKSPPPPQEELKPRPPATSGYAPKAFHVEDTPVCFSRNSSLSSLSIDSEDDLLQECISSAMPKKKKKAATATQLPVPKSEDDILAEEEPSEVPRSPASPDSESFDWKAIQEGANSIVSSLNAAAAAASSLSRQPSSDSDSVLSLKSVGSPFRLPAANNNAEEEVEEKEEEAAVKRGARILKGGERSTLEARKEEEEAAKALRGGKKVYRSLITGKPRAEPAARGRSKPRAAAVAKAPGSGDSADRGGGSSRDSTPSRSSTAANQKGGRLLQAPRTASPGSASSSSSSASRPAKQSGTVRSGGGIPRSESASRVSGSAALKKQKAEPEKPALVRQSTFIKEAPSPTLKRKLEESAAAAVAAATGLESPSSPDTPLPSTTRRHDINRSHSESPSRPQDVTSSRFSRTGTWKRENSGGGGGGSGGKHSTSLPRVGTWKRTGSSSSVLSASSESSEKGRSEEESAVRSKGTWRKAKSGADSSVGRSFTDKSEDVWVRLEDCPVNNPRSSSSCSARSPSSTNAPPVIDSPAPSKIPSSSSSSSSNLNLRRSCESLDDKPQPERQQPQPQPQPQQQQQQQRSQQRSGAVAARVSPFNYTPSPRKSSADVTATAAPTTTTTSSSTTPTRPSLIPTPVTKKREPKGGEGSGGGSSGGERGSYIVTSV
ncbi:adenomatous polyposis coli protein isoform X2 [Plectropomus leopardus]|uniref:adenomatous polyposis coli protein isoform X2 n=1 Tax=Plectropomus leopardus TaxID=160734 RepID=UPI001C4BF598|nr:adenomatous polyposis coli protein isoform X2 [Plectropomus leopardus]